MVSEKKRIIQSTLILTLQIGKELKSVLLLEKTMWNSNMMTKSNGSTWYGQVVVTTFQLSYLVGAETSWKQIKEALRRLYLPYHHLSNTKCESKGQLIQRDFP